MAFPELDGVFRDLLSSNRGPGFGVSVAGAASDLSVIDVDLRFLAGKTYCCAEPGCHLPSSSERVRWLAAERSIRIPDHVVVRWHCRVEEGCRLECLKHFGLPLESAAYEFEATTGGADAGTTVK